MKAVLELTEARAKVRIEQLKELTTKLQAEYNSHRNTKKLLEVSFPELEREYNDWKKELEEKKACIDDEQNELNTLQHFDKFKHQPKPHLIQQQVITKKYKQEFTPLPNIKWTEIIEPALIELNRFVGRSELWKYIVDNNMIKDDSKNKVRFSQACNSTKNKWYMYNPDKVYGGGHIGMRNWDVAKHLNDFYHERNKETEIGSKTA